MRRQAIYRETVTTTNIVTTSTSTPIKVNDARTISVQSVIDVNTPAAKAFAAGTADVKTLTFEAFADIVDREYFVVYSQDGQAWAIYFDKTGTSIAPTGAIYTAIPASNKAKADISGDILAAQVAATVETAINALTGFTALIVTNDSAANGTMTFTQTSHGTVTAAVSKLLDDSGSGGVGIANTTPGVASDVSVSANTITESSHGFTTGLKGQASSTATLPAGLSAATDYFVIVVDANTYKLATSYANAIAGTAIDMTNQGTSAATHTFTPTSIAGGAISLEKSNNYNPITGSGDFDPVETATSITADGDIWISDVEPEYEWVRLKHTLTAGRLSAASYILIKGDI